MRQMCLRMAPAACLLAGLLGFQVSPVVAEPNTAGKISLGGRSKFGLSATTAPISGSNSSDVAAALSTALLTGSNNSGFVSVRYGLNQDMNLTGLLGLDIYNSSSESKSGDTTVTSTRNLSTFALGAQFDYILAKFEQSRVYVGGSVILHGLGGASARESTTNTTTSTSTPLVFSLIPTLGYEHFLAPRLSLEGAVGLPISFSSSSVGSTSTSNFAMNIAFQPFVGMNYYF